MEEQKKNPKLRFKGFMEDWKILKMRDVSIINQGLQISISNRYKSKIPNSHFYITNEFLKEGTKTEYYILNPPESVLCDKKDILMTRTGNTGEVVTDVNGAFHNNFFKIKYNSDIDKNFLVSFLRSEKTQKLIGELAGISTIPDLNHNDFYNIDLSHPNKDEQIIIGAFLMGIDELITKNQKKHNHLITFKKSMLEKMFPKEGQAVPEIRFKGFEGDWEEKELKELGFFNSNGVDKKTNAEETPVNLLNYMDVYKSKNITSSNCQNLMKVTAKKNQLLDNNILKGDVFFTPSSEVPDDIGRVLTIKDNLPNTVYSYHLMRFRPEKNTLCDIYTDYGFSYSLIRKQFIVAAQGIQRYTISKPAFENIEVLIPSLKEQVKIGRYFQSIDSVISSHKKQLTKLKNFKQSLSEKMFV